MHPCSDHPGRRARGFSLIEVAIAVAVMAILAGAAVPFALKALNQAREAKTRENLKSAYEAMFGARDRRVPNMRADFGFFNPAAGTPNLAVTTQPLGTRAYAPYGGAAAALSGGWRGPYWTGSTGPTGLPLDGWGRPLILRVSPGANPTVQLLSVGANGVRETNNANPNAQPNPVGDDLAYPIPPALLPMGTLTLSLRRMGAGPLTATSVVAYLASATNAPTVANLLPVGAGTGIYRALNLGTGEVLVTATVPPQPAIPAAGIAAVPGNQVQSQLVEIPPSGSVTLTFNFN